MVNSGTVVTAVFPTPGGVPQYAGGAMFRLGYEGASKFTETLAEVRG